MKDVRAKKHLGQHFLRDESIAENIAKALPVGITNVLEIGPGMGVLTKYLHQNPDFLLKVVEIDTESVAYLHNKYPELTVFSDDFLKMNLDGLFDGNFAVIGNFPYNISSQILFKVLEHRNAAPCVVGMFQKEVAERIAAKSGNKTYGILSVLFVYRSRTCVFAAAKSEIRCYSPHTKLASTLELRRKTIFHCCKNCLQSTPQNLTQCAFRNIRQIAVNRPDF